MMAYCRMDELTMLLEVKQTVTENLQLVEIELILADPETHSDDEHDFLIKKVRMLRDSLTKINHRLKEPGY